jgi:hypothetical protein
MHSIDVALRRNASDVFGVPATTLSDALARRYAVAVRGSALVAGARFVLVRRVPLLLAVALTLQLFGGVFTDPTRVVTPMMSTAATVAGAVSSGAAAAGAAVSAVSTVNAAARAASLQSIAIASYVDPVERTTAFDLLDSTRVAPTVALNPRTTDRILDAGLPATGVAAWWETLSATERGAVAAASPTLIGNLDGIPLTDRVAANRETAARSLAAFPRTGSHLSSAEASYLARVASGTVSLYAFDVARDSIVEIIGDVEAATRTLVFTPGTSATLADFYSGSMQSLAMWEVEHATTAEPTAAFVYKIGSFPQWTVSDGPLDNHRSIQLGVLFDRFNEGLDTTTIGALARTSVEHSFGSSIGGVAETLGSHFDTRIVLGGVGMLAGWEPSASTRYVAYVAGNDVTRYMYGLVKGDTLGYAVAPSAANGFEQHDPKLETDSWYLPLRLLAGIVGPAIEVAQGFINHNRVASATGNTAVLESVLSEVVGAGQRHTSDEPDEDPAAPLTPHLDPIVLASRESLGER